MFSKIQFCFKHIQLPYFNLNKKVIFNHLNSDHYAMFLYLLSNAIYKIDKNEELASRIFLLNKALHGLDAFYTVELPEIFVFVHPVGSVLGRAKYSNYFCLYQNCTVGSTKIGEYASFEGECVMFSKSSVIGKCNIGKNVVFGANASVINSDIEQNSVVLGNYPNNKIIENKKNVIDRVFR